MLTAAILAAALIGSSPPAQLRETIAASDNEMPAGKRHGRTLRLSLDARWGVWYPDGRGHAGVPMLAFAESGKPLQVPGPLIRVPVGTQVVLRVRNSIPATSLTIHGIVSRPSDQDAPFTVPFGSVHTTQFRLDKPGTYAYWAATRENESITSHVRWDSQLGGAIVVDPANSHPALATDRTFIITTWVNVVDANGSLETWYALDTINGLAWPYTERLVYRQGDVVRWRWINLGAASHPMHMHGFYFRVDARGDGIGENAYANAVDRELRNTELIRPGSTFSVTWTADRPGNWLFHCHIPGHTVAHLPISEMLSGHGAITIAQYLGDYVPHAGMGNLVIGMSVKPRTSTHVRSQRPMRNLALVVEQRPESASTAPAFRYVIEDGSTQLFEARHVGPSLVLTQGQPVAIKVVNHLAEPTTVHWHGIELDDSYYDGVSGFSGYAERTAPMIEPGGSFEVHFTPRRSGTFAYHAHVHDQWQFRGGLVGPLIVLPRGSTFDKENDHVVMLTTPAIDKAFPSAVLFNGALHPDPIVLHTDSAQRLRLINMMVANANAVVSLEAASGPVLWRPLAIDGADLPVARHSPQRAVQVLTIGQTRDFAYESSTAGDLLFVVRRSAKGPILGTLPVRVI